MTMIPLDSFRDIVADIPMPTDVQVDDSWTWELVGEGPSLGIEYGHRRVGPLPMYQARSLYGAPSIDLTGTKRHLRRAAAGDARSEYELRRQVALLNLASRGYTFTTKPVIARTVLGEDGTVRVGGLVSQRYLPLGHLELLDLMVANVGFDGAMVHRHRVTPGRLDATIMLDGEWEVDGGVKSGMKMVNGQFGDTAYGWMAMLFELICTNGMMDVVDSEAFFRRHVTAENIDLAADVAASLKRADEMFARSRAATEVEADALDIIVELYRHGLLTRGALKRVMQARDEMESQVRGDTLWGAARLITAGARDYAFTQFEQMGRLAGRLVFEGADAVIESRPLIADVPSHAEVLKELTA